MLILNKEHFEQCFRFVLAVIPDESIIVFDQDQNKNYGMDVKKASNVTWGSENIQRINKTSTLRTIAAVFIFETKIFTTELRGYNVKNNGYQFLIVS